MRFPLYSTDSGTGGTGSGGTTATATQEQGTQGTGAQTGTTTTVPSVTDGFAGTSGLPAEFAKDPLFQGYDSLEKVFADFMALKVMKQRQEELGIITVPDEKTPPEQVEEFWQKLGKPRTPADYDFKAPEDLPEGLDFSDELAADWAKFFHELNLPKDVAQKIFNKYHDMLKEQYSQYEGQMVQSLEANLVAMEQQWGAKADSPQFQQYVANAQKVFQRFGDEAMAKELDAKPLVKSDPTILRLLATIGASLSNDTVPTMIDVIPSGKFQDSLPAIERQLKDFKDSGKLAKAMDPSDPQHRSYLDEYRAMLNKKRELMLKQT